MESGVSDVTKTGKPALLAFLYIYQAKNIICKGGEIVALSKKKKVNDILEQKEAKLAALTKQSDDAVQLVRNTMNGLETVDQEIDATISEIDAIQTRMANTKAGLEARRSKNQQIMHNFKSLLCEE